MRFLATTLLAAAGAVSAASAVDISDPPAEKLQVHIIPHTHDDIGWEKTVREYDRGLNMTISFGNTSHILEQVTLALEQNPERKFTYVEQGFFQRWWRRQNSGTTSLL
jgi:hypothetical protein